MIPMKIVFLDASTVTSANDVDLSAVMALGEWVQYPITNPSETAERIADAEVVISNKVLLDGNLIDNAAKLRLIAVAATGTNNVDLEAAKAAGVQVCNVSGYSTESVAQHTIAMLLNLATKMHRYGNEPQAWADSPIFTRLDYPVTSLHGSTLGLVGVGNIGGRVGEIAEALGMTVQCYGRPGSAQAVHPEWPRRTIEELLETSDTISLHCPLTEDTRSLIN
ncbi:MAG: glycerate dehydrogenase, partial [Verrucomicrobiales bacterium]